MQTWGKSARDGRSGLCLSQGQGKHEGISSHKDASPGMCTVHMGDFWTLFFNGEAISLPPLNLPHLSV